jgi:hypothetical protein
MAILNKFKITEISGVDKPACKHCQALIIKRDSGSPAERGGNAMEINFRKMVEIEDAVAFEKHWNAGDFDGISKAEWHVLITKRASQIRTEGETPERAYTRLITADPAGRAMFRAFQQTDGRALYKRVFDESIAKAVRAEIDDANIGPAHREMHALAIDRQRATGRTYAQSYARVYSENAALREKVKSEFLARAMRMGAGGSDIDGGTELGGPGSMTLSEAQRMEPAPKFPNAPGRAYG